MGKHNFAPTTFHEAVKFLGILLLITRFEFGSQRDLWSAFRRSNYIPAANLGKTGISKNRFDQLIKCWRWSHQPEQRPTNMSSEEFRWMLVEDFVELFNDWRAKNFCPGENVVVDESMS